MTVILQAGGAVAVIEPALGGGVRALTVEDHPVLRRSAAESRDPFDFGMIVMAPFCNRLARKIHFAGVRHDIPPNLATENYAIHGDAFQRPWHILASGPAQLELQLDQGEIGPWRYRAKVAYHLTPGTFTATLTLENAGEMALPFGMGFHPWFPRTKDTALKFHATHCWPEGKDHLPAVASALPVPEDRRFDEFRLLPTSWINEAFSGWDGRASVQQGKNAVSFDLQSENLPIAMLFSPGTDSNFFCFEPQSHSVNAFQNVNRDIANILPPRSQNSCRLDLEW